MANNRRYRQQVTGTQQASEEIVTFEKQHFEESNYFMGLAADIATTRGYGNSGPIVFEPNITVATVGNRHR